MSHTTRVEYTEIGNTTYVLSSVANSDFSGEGRLVLQRMKVNKETGKEEVDKVLFDVELPAPLIPLLSVRIVQKFIMDKAEEDLAGGGLG